MNDDHILCVINCLIPARSVHSVQHGVFRRCSRGAQGTPLGGVEEVFGLLYTGFEMFPFP